jgi:hypothetical protein
VVGTPSEPGIPAARAREAGCFWSRFTATSSNGTGAFGLQLQQQVQQRVAVLAAGQAHHHLVAGLDHAEVGNRLADLAAQALGQLGCSRSRRRGRTARGACTPAEAARRGIGSGSGRIELIAVIVAAAARRRPAWRCVCSAHVDTT